MTYWVLNLAFVLAAIVMAAIFTVAARKRSSERRQSGERQPSSERGLSGKRPRNHRPATMATAVAVTFGLLCLLTAIFDNVMIAAGLFEYSAEQISGWRIGAAPVEDFLYVLAAAALLPALWRLLAAKSPGPPS